MRCRWWICVGISLGLSIGATAGNLGLAVPLMIANGIFVLGLVVVLWRRTVGNR